MNYIRGISFIIPAWNEEETIVQCIESIQRELVHFPKLKSEIIVVDNMSTDDTVQRAVMAGAKVVYEKRKGVVRSRNHGYKKSKYYYIANIDADNRIPEGWLYIGLKELQKHHIAIVSGPIVYDNVSPIVRIGGKFFYFLAKFFHYVAGPTAQGGNFIIKRSVLDRMGGYDTSYQFYGEDTSTAQRAAKFGRIKLVSKMWVHSSPRRLEKQGLFNTIWTYTLNYFSVCIIGRQVTYEHKDYR